MKRKLVACLASSSVLLLLSSVYLLRRFYEAEYLKRANSAAAPAKRVFPDNRWVDLHALHVQRSDKKDLKGGYLFLGDSITFQFGIQGAAAFEKHFGSRHSAFFGIGGDCTQHLLWRIQNGELACCTDAGASPKAIVLNIGTNNIGINTADEIAEGISAVVTAIDGIAAPSAALIITLIFPRGQHPNPFRDAIAAVNTKVRSHFAADVLRRRVFFIDLGPQLLEQDGMTISTALLPDFIHLSSEAYERWCRAVVDIEL